jgi:hypothetical protein
MNNGEEKWKQKISRNWISSVSESMHETRTKTKWRNKRGAADRLSTEEHKNLQTELGKTLKWNRIKRINKTGFKLRTKRCEYIGRKTTDNMALTFGTGWRTSGRRWWWWWWWWYNTFLTASWFKYELYGDSQIGCIMVLCSCIWYFRASGILS